MPVNPFALTEGVPAGRVGARLLEARRAAGMGRWRASRVAQVSRTNLVRMERGRMRPPDGTVIALCRTYDVAVSWLVPERSGNEVVVGAGRIEVAGRTRLLSGGDGDGEHAVEAVLGSYLAIVRELRGVAAGGVVSLRDEDLVALARALGDTPSEIEARLVDLMKLSREEARAVRRELLKRRVAVPAAGLLLATAAVAGSLDSGSGGGADLAAGGTFPGARAEHAVDQGGTTSGASATLPGDGATGGVGIATPTSHSGGGSAVTPNVSVGGDDVVIGDAVSFVRDTPPPAAPRVVVPLPSVSQPPADDGSVEGPDTPGVPGGDVTVVVADPGTGGAPGGDTGTVDPGTGGAQDGGAQNGGGQNDNAHGGNENANPNATDAGGNSTDGGSNGGGTAVDDNAHGANDNASPNATDAPDNSGGGGAADENAHGGNDNANPNASGGPANADQPGGANPGGDNANAHGGNPNASDNAADAGNNGNGNSGANGNSTNGDANAHGGNANASGNAADGGANGGPGSESAGAASPSANGNGASNAHGRP